jgi:hypothetical protein
MLQNTRELDILNFGRFKNNLMEVSKTHPVQGFRDNPMHAFDDLYNSPQPR